MAFRLSSTRANSSEMTQVLVHPMTGGNDLHSYRQNSSFQRKAVEESKKLIDKSVAEKLDIENFSSLETFCIADLGCAVGPNTIIAVQNIIKAVKEKFFTEGQSCNTPEFQVFFNDQASNDFNQLFVSLAPNKQYFAAGVPGSFYDRLFPINSLHFVHSSFSCQWLSKIPEQVLDKRSPAWNKGRVHYSSSRAEVIKAYEDQFGEDMDKFLQFREQEIVCGGLLAIIMPGRSNGTPHNQTFINKLFEHLESILKDMSKEGKIGEEKVDSFNIANYFASLEEVELSVHRNGCFKIEMMENILHEKGQPQLMISTFRACMGENIKQHFGEEIFKELFDSPRLAKKFEDSKSIYESCESVTIFVLLKRI